MAMADEEMEIAPPVPQPIFLADEEFQKYVSVLRNMGTPTCIQCEVENNNREAVYAMLVPKLKKLKKEIVFMDGKGECFFRAFAHQFFNDGDLHPFVRAATILFMRRNPILYAVDFSKILYLGPFQQFLDSMSRIYEPVGELIMQGACDAFSVSIFRVCSFTTRPMPVLYPKNLIHYRELSMSFVPTHVDSIFNEGELPIKFQLTEERIAEIRESGAVRHEDIAGCVRFMG